MFKDSSPNRGYVAAVLAPFFIALSVILTKYAGASTYPLVISAIGSLISVPVLLAVALVARKPLALRKIITELRVPFLKVLLSRSVIGQALIVTGFTMTSAFKAVLLLRVEPLFVFLWSLYYSRVKPTPGRILLLLALIAGSALVIAPSGAAGAAHDGPCLGDALIVAALLFLSFSYAPTHEVVEGASPAGLNILGNLCGGVLLTLMALFWCPHEFSISANALALIASYSLVFFVFASSLYFEAFRTLKPWVIASFLSLEVVFGMVLAALMLHESFTPQQLLGAAVVIAATITIGCVGE